MLSFGSSDDKAIRRRRSQLRTPQPVAAGYMTNNWDTLLEGGRGGGGTGRDGFGRQITENSGGQFSSSSSVGDGEAPRLTPVKPKGKSRRCCTCTFLKCIQFRMEAIMYNVYEHL